MQRKKLTRTKLNWNDLQPNWSRKDESKLRRVKYSTLRKKAMIAYFRKSVYVWRWNFFLNVIILQNYFNFQVKIVACVILSRVVHNFRHLDFFLQISVVVFTFKIYSMVHKLEFQFDKIESIWFRCRIFKIEILAPLFEKVSPAYCRVSIPIACRLCSFSKAHELYIFFSCKTFTISFRILEKNENFFVALELL